MDWSILIMPGEFLARRYDSGYLDFVENVEVEGGKRFPWPVIEYVLAVFVGLVSGILSLAWPIFLLLAAYPFIAIFEPWVWRKHYGEIDDRVGVQGALLANLDLLYLFSVGYIIGFAIL